MGHQNVYEAVDCSLQDIRNNGRPFGGMTVVFGGDFEQTPPIIPRGSWEQFFHACLTHSRLFHHTRSSTLLRTCALHTIGIKMCSGLQTFSLTSGLAEIFLLMVISRYLKISSSLAPPLNHLSTTSTQASPPILTPPHLFHSSHDSYTQEWGCACCQQEHHWCVSGFSCQHKSLPVCRFSNHQGTGIRCDTCGIPQCHQFHQCFRFASLKVNPQGWLSSDAFMEPGQLLHSWGNEFWMKKSHAFHVSLCSHLKRVNFTSCLGDANSL